MVEKNTIKLIPFLLTDVDFVYKLDIWQHTNISWVLVFKDCAFNGAKQTIIAN